MKKYARWKAATAALLLSIGLGMGLVPEPAAAQGGNGITVCIDPGHQEKGDHELEPVAPGSRERKAKVSSGTTGAATGIPEYELNLAVSLKLRDILVDRGYHVVMTRESHQVSLSNIERAEIGNRAQADLVVRVHADGSESESVQGISLLYPSAAAVDDSLYKPSRRAAEVMLSALLERTGAESRGTIPRSDLTGFNWSKVPAVLVEMGFMSNAREDRLMATDDYRTRLALGMAEGIDRFFAEQQDLLQPEEWSGRLLLLKDTPLYDRKGRIFADSGVSLGPQLLQANARSGEWYRVDTWMGPLWLKGGSGAVLENAAVPADPGFTLEKPMELYEQPDPGGNPVGTLAPQRLTILWEWNGWRCVETWLGECWIRP